MAMSTGTSNALLGVLAALAVGTSGYAIWSVQQPPETSEWTVQADNPLPHRERPRCDHNRRADSRRSDRDHRRADPAYRAAH